MNKCNFEIKNPEDELCPVEVTLRLIDNKWKIIILRDLLEKATSFGDLHRSVTGISRKVLTENLKSMENDHIIIREEIPGAVVTVMYKLSPLGESMRSVVKSMQDWGSGYIKNHPQEAVQAVIKGIKK